MLEDLDDIGKMTAEIEQTMMVSLEVDGGDI
jgi:hypothetical protein